MIETEEQARTFCAERCDSAAMERLEQFIPMLAAENQQQNLVSKSSLDMVWTRHIADSLQLIDHVPRGTLYSLQVAIEYSESGAQYW